MSTPVSETTPLGMTEAYHTAQQWLAFVGEPTTRIEDPTDGVLQLYTARHMVRIRVDDEPAGQGAVIAMLRAAAELDDLDVAMFSPTGYNPSALEFAEMRNIALFTLTHLGGVVGETVAARAMMPKKEFVPVFSERANRPGLDDEVEVAEETDGSSGADEPGVEWVVCTRCGAQQHPELALCAVCGSDLSVSEETEPAAIDEAAIHGTPAPPILTSLRCNSCGSHDIELLRLTQN